MNKAANSYWTDIRLAAQRPAARTLRFDSPVRELSRELVGTRAEVRRRGGLVPSWVLFTMIMLATFALCVTVTMRTHAEMRGAGQKLEQINTDIDGLRNTNEALRRELLRLRSDPRAIEAAARTQLNMVRPNEIVVPLN